MKPAFLPLLASLVASAAAYTDTAPFYASQNWHLPPYIAESSQVSLGVKNATAAACDGGLQAVIYRVANLQPGKPHADGVYFKHVHYKTASDLELHILDSCLVAYVSSVSELAAQKASVVVVDVDDGEEHAIDEFSAPQGRHLVVVQGKPAFHRPNLDGIKQFMENKLYDHLNVDIELASEKNGREHRGNRKHHGKRPKRDFFDDEYQLESQIEDDFRAAEAFIAAEGDSMVTALADDFLLDVQAAAASAPLKTGNLFTHYQFFTPGIFLALLVSGFLLFVLYTALGWMTSLEISYLSFEKQIDYEKKTE